MKDAPTPGYVTLNNMVNNLRSGKYEIPDFQRDFEWQPWDINELIKSIFRDYYIGNLLLWKGKDSDFDVLSCEPIYGFAGNGERTHIVLDGQQRLTAMYYAFVAPEKSVPRRQNRYLYFIRVDRFMEDDNDEAFVYDWTRRGTNLLQDQTEQYRTHMFPLAIVGAPGWAIPNWVQGYVRYWSNVAANGEGADAEEAGHHAENAKGFSRYLEDLTQQYNVAYIELDSDIAIEKVCEIFTQINSRGVGLDVFDLINALLRPKGLRLRQELWREAAPRLEFIESGRMNVYVLQVMSILKQAYCSPKYLYFLLPGATRHVRGSDGAIRPEVLIASTNEFEKHWHEAVDALTDAIDLLKSPQEFGAIAFRFLPYPSILPALASLEAEAKKLSPFLKLGAQRKIRFWYWASVFNNRYSGSVESTTARDYLDVKEWFNDENAEPRLIADFRQTFRNLSLIGEVRRGTSVYNGIFNLLTLNGARDWITGNVPQASDLDDHHIVPKSRGSEFALRTQIDSILNRSPLTSETNQWIGNRLPNEYLPQLIEENGELEVHSILESHLISQQAFHILMRPDFTPSDYDEFCAERQRTMLSAIESLLIKERLDLSPRDRELDTGIERVELELRRTIAQRLNYNVNSLPSHVQQRVKERLQVDMAKNPALDSDHYGTLTGQLEYVDLRELQDIITNRTLWTLFQDIFSNKELLDQRFHQLAALRNSIRHSRTVDEITRKDGEAAILWFEQVQNRHSG